MGSTLSPQSLELALRLPLQPSEGDSEGFYFWKPPPAFSALLSTPCPFLGGTARPPHYGRGRQRNSSNTHFGTGKQAGGEGD